MAIRNIKHKGLRELFHNGSHRRLGKQFAAAATMILDHLGAAVDLGDCEDVRGFHELEGNRKGTFAMIISRNWLVTFKYEDGEFADLNFEDYH